MLSHPTPLSRLLDGAGGEAELVAFGRDGVRTRRDLAVDAAALTSAIEAAGSGRWLLVTDDSYAAAVALLAVAATRSLAVLPPNRQPETLRQLAVGVVGVLCDDGRPPVAGLPALALLGRHRAAPALPAKLDRDAPLVEFQTSGTTGKAEPVPKALRHLEDEVVVLERQLGHHVPREAKVFATASHQHIYGLLFRLVWPLVAGRAFQWETLLHAQELLPRMLACNAAVLVTTPVQLKRLAGSGRLRDLRGVCQAVYSSGGPLAPETAGAVADQLGAAPVEVLGSTETGGIAIRRRDVDGDVWQPLPGVAIRRCEADGRLEVTSPFVSIGETVEGGRSRTVLGDRIELAGERGFLLQGRADRVVKVGEKRLSLPEMEQVLGAHPGASEAALLVLEQAGERRVHAVVTPSEAGRALVQRAGRRALRTELSRHLAGRFDPVLLPRAWRFVDALPRDSQDKVPQAALRALFDNRAAARPRAPTLLVERREAAWLEQRLEVPSDLAQIEGHFDDFPVVPGVVQLGWVLAAAASWCGAPPRLEALEALKFPEPLRPGRQVTLELRLADAGRLLRFRIYAEDCVFTSGRAVLLEPSTPRTA